MGNLQKVAKYMEMKYVKNASFQDDFGAILDNVSRMEGLFISARDATEDPLKKVVLTGMYNDWLNFKAEKWREAIDYILASEQAA